MASSWILFFSYQDDARSNTHQIYLDVDPYTQPVLTNEVNGTMFYFLHINLRMVSLAKFIQPETGASI